MELITILNILCLRSPLINSNSWNKVQGHHQDKSLHSHDHEHNNNGSCESISDDKVEYPPAKIILQALGEVRKQAGRQIK